MKVIFTKDFNGAIVKDKKVGDVCDLDQSHVNTLLTLKVVEYYQEKEEKAPLKTKEEKHTRKTK